MSTNCLVTKLKGTVDNDNLHVFGALKIEAKAITPGNAGYFFLNTRTGFPITITCDTAFSVYGSNPTTGANEWTIAESVNEYTKTAETNALLKISVPSSGDAVVFYVHNKYNLTVIRKSSKNGSTFNCAIDYPLSELSFNEYLTEIEKDETKYTDDTINSLVKSKDTLQELIINNNVTAGSINQFTELRYVNIMGSYRKVAADFETLTCPSINYFYAQGNKNVIGDAYDWALRLWNNGSGKTSGNIFVKLNGSRATLGESEVKVAGNTLTFAAGGVTVD